MEQNRSGRFKNKMAEKINVQEDVIEETGFALVENAQKAAQSAFRVSLGAADMAREEVMTLLEKTQNEVSEILERVINRGESIEGEGRKYVESAFSSRRQQVEEAVSTTKSGFETRVESVLNSLNVPSKSDIDALSKKIAALTKKVNELAKSQ